MRTTRRLLASAAALALVVPLAACASGPSSAAEALEMLNASMAETDRERFDAVLDGSIPQSTRDMWWSNLTQLGDVGVTETGDGWQVDWSLPGEQATASHAVDMAIGCVGGLCRITRIEPVASRPAPEWLVEPVDVITADGAVLIVGRGASDLSAAAGAAARAIGDSGMALLDTGSEAPLPIEVPATGSAYALVTGTPSTQTQGLGALTRRAGEAVRVVVNPARAGQWSPTQQTMLLTHEAVHWRLARLGAPVAGNAWVSEGLAEWLALPQDATERASSAAKAVQGCQDSGGAPALPTDDEFAAADDADALRRAYALSWAAVSELVDELGADAAGDLVEQLWTTPGDQVGEVTGVLARWCAANVP